MGDDEARPRLPCVAEMAAMITTNWDVIDAGRAIARACKERGLDATVYVKASLDNTNVEFGYPTITKAKRRKRGA